MQPFNHSNHTGSCVPVPKVLTRALGRWTLALLVSLSWLGPDARGADLIPESEIADLQTDLSAATGEAGSVVAKRRALKNVVREAQAAISMAPEAPNRFEVLGVVLEVQKRLLALENSERNRTALFETAEALIKAPDAYAELRLEADLLLSERRQSEAQATLAERATALEALLERYRGTVAEARSLMLASLIVRKLDAPDLEQAIRSTMDEMYFDDVEVVEFRNKHLQEQRLDVRFKAEFERMDGARFRFPADALGHLCLLVFWSEKARAIEPLMQTIKDYEAQYPGRFTVFSLNVDERPDAGQSILKKRGLDWTVLRVRGGRAHPAYRAYAQRDALALLVNAYGYTVLTPEAHMDAITGLRSLQSDVFGISPERISDERYLSQMQWLFSGGFLVVSDEGRPASAEATAGMVASGEGSRSQNTQAPKYPQLKAGPPQAGNTQGDPKPENPKPRQQPLMQSEEAASLDVEGGALERGSPFLRKISRGGRSIPNEKLQAIRACFVPPPFRYRLTREEALAGYRKAETLCAEALKKDIGPLATADVRHCRIIALLGMANLSIEPKYLAQAVDEAKAATKEQPEAAHVVARFCLAKAELRDLSGEASTVVSDFFDACGGSNSAPASAVAGAAMLALEAGSRKLHEDYRRLFLEKYASDPRYYGFASFLRDTQHRFRLLMPNHTKRERYDRYHVVSFGASPPTTRLPRIELKHLDGRPLVLPDAHVDKMTILLFIEPPEAEGENFPRLLDRHGKPDYSSGVRGMVHYAQLLAEKHIHQEIDLIVAFLSDDAERVAWLMETNAWTFQAAMVPGGLSNPMVNRLGILSADRFPNVFVLHRDDSIAWWASGMEYRDFGNPWVRHLAMKVHIEASEVAYGVELLENGDFEKAAHTFAGPYLPWRPDRYGWRPVRYHGRSLALAGAGDWAGALEAINKSIDAHKLRHFKGRRSKNPANWREDAATVEISEPCAVLAELWATKTTILEKLDKRAEAEATRVRSRDPVGDEHTGIYAEFHEKLKLLAPSCLHGEAQARRQEDLSNESKERASVKN